jgi:purine-binding chemotaxis protein CheW
VAQSKSESSRIDFAKIYEHLENSARLLAQEEASSAEQSRILAQRTRALAQTRVQEKAFDLEVLAFRVGGERYAVRITEADEVLDSKSVCPLIGAPRHMLGAVVARSRVLPVLDLRRMLGIEGSSLSDLTQIVVVGKSDELFGLAVEEVEGKLGLTGGGERPSSGPFHLITADRLAVLDLALLLEHGESTTPSG